jgi:hypothetical protein
MKCMFNPEIECTVSKVLEELERTIDPMEILDKACPLCPKRPHPERLKRT